MQSQRNTGQSKREIALVINLRSRSGPRASETALKELAMHGVQVRESRLVRHGNEVVEAVNDVIARGAHEVVVGGGDGTISSIAGLFANKQDLILGLLPMGTGNEVARILGIPLDIRGACKVIAEGKVKTVDLVEANGNFFIHTALMGYPAHMNHAIPDWLKLHFGKAAYTYSLLASLIGAKPFHTTISATSNMWTGKTIVVVVGNNQFHIPGRVLLPESEVAERGLSIYTPRDTRFITIIRLVIGLWITRQPLPSLLFSLTDECIMVEAQPRQDVDLDGEFCCLTPTEFRLARDALRMIVPGSNN